LDLGLDSMERVELFAELEERFGTTIPQHVAAEILTVRQLVEVLPHGAVKHAAQAWEAWAAILRNLPARTDPGLGWLLRKRPIAARLWFVVLRIARLLFVRVRVRGLENLPASGPYIITPNHQSYVDPFILSSVVPYRVFKDLFFVGAIEYFETPFTRWVARTANLVPVDPDSKLVPAMQAGAFGLTHGRILMLFPEGERTIDGTVKKFKKGAPILARHLNVPMVPVALKGIYELWPRNGRINWRLVAPWSGHRVRIDIGEPMRPAGGTNYDDGAVTLRDRVNAMWQALSS
jgi:long-chain acyl-CoA synthetase